MAKIKRIFFNSELTYPMTITDAIIDTKTNTILTTRLENIETAVQTGTEPIDQKDIRRLIND